MEKGIYISRSQNSCSLLHGKIKVSQTGGYHPHNIGNGQNRMSNQQAGQSRKLKPVGYIAEHNKTKYNHRNQHRRKEKSFDKLFSPKAVAVQSIGRRKSQNQSKEGSGKCNNDTVFCCASEGFYLQNLRIPLEGKALAREFQVCGITEGGRHNDKKRPNQENIYQHSNKKQ